MGKPDDDQCKGNEIAGSPVTLASGVNVMKFRDLSSKVSKSKSGAIDPILGATVCVTGERMKSKELKSSRVFMVSS